MITNYYVLTAKMPEINKHKSGHQILRLSRLLVAAGLHRTEIGDDGGTWFLSHTADIDDLCKEYFPTSTGGLLLTAEFTDHDVKSTTKPFDIEEVLHQWACDIGEPIVLKLRLESSVSINVDFVDYH